ncbi:hypothetical protein LTR97_008620 [Elasticomyces elasticus]|uniref:Uncharacterized protein n=1 Tax=Elasticomyces elasticus TaxID=574655 RepID=A0AAN7W5E5_9PEZI|nr:hypothetical protein LTR97_008620 [Elasticomyces elasticus]
MELTKHAERRRTWSGVTSRDGAIAFSTNMSRQIHTLTKDDSLAVKPNRLARSSSAPCVLPTLMLPTPLSYGTGPSKGFLDFPGMSANHLTPPNTVPLSQPSLANATSLIASGCRPSTPPTMSKSPVQLPQQNVEPYRARKLLRLVDRVLRKRTQFDYHVDSWFRNHKFLDESAAELSAAMNATDGPNVTHAQLERFDELRAQYRGDCNRIESESRTLTRIQSSLSNLEYLLKDQEDALSSIVHTFTRPSTSNASASDSDEAYTSTSIKSNTNPLLRRYYDRKGDEGIYLLRLQEHDILYSEGLVERELVAERGDPLPLSDEQYEHDFREYRDRILADLKAAQADVDQLRAQCEEAGLETEVVRAEVHDEGPSSPHSVEYDEIPPP